MQLSGTFKIQYITKDYIVLKDKLTFYIRMKGFEYLADYIKERGAKYIYCYGKLTYEKKKMYLFPYSFKVANEQKELIKKGLVY